MKSFFSRISNTIHNDLKENILKVAIILALLATVYILFENIFAAFVVAAFASVVLLRWDGRIFFALGLLFLLFCPFLLAFNQKSGAEDMAIYAYYMLVFGVVMQIVQHTRESFSSRKTIQKEIHSVENFLNKKKIWVISLTIMFCTVLFSSFAFYFFYSKIKEEFNNEKLSFQNLLEQTKPKLNEKKTESVLEAPIKKQIVSDWETVHISFENNTGNEFQTKIFLEQFKNLGVLNVQVSSSSKQIDDFTFIEYCQGCNNVARELLSVLKNLENITLLEVPELENQIILHLGKDQTLLTPKDISLSILNGTTIPGKAGILRDEMQKAGFHVQSIADAPTKDHIKTLLISRPGQTDAVFLIKNFLSNTYKNIEVQENTDLPVDVQIILGALVE